MALPICHPRTTPPKPEPNACSECPSVWQPALLPLSPEMPMRFEKFSFSSIRIDGVTHKYDVVIDRGIVRKRKKKASKKFRDAFGHTPLSVEEKIPWKCRRLVIGTGPSSTLRQHMRGPEASPRPNGCVSPIPLSDCRQ